MPSHERPKLPRRRGGCRIPAATPFHEGLPVCMAAAGAPGGNGPRPGPILSPQCLRNVGGLRPTSVDWRGRGLLLESQETREDRAGYGQVYTMSPGESVQPPLLQVAGLESAAMDQPAVYRIVPAKETILGRLALAPGTIVPTQPEAGAGRPLQCWLYLSASVYSSPQQQSHRGDRLG